MVDLVAENFRSFQDLFSDLQADADQMTSELIFGPVKLNQTVEV